MAGTKTEIIITGLQAEIVKVVTARLNAAALGNHDIAIAWKNMQDMAAEEIRNLLGKHLPASVITSPATKSTYPDIKIVNAEGMFAIDLKANEDTKDPWFDMARLDTFKKLRIAKYVEEWELVVKYRTSDGKFIKAYFDLFRNVAGIRPECNGVKFRAKDGNIRPKSWADLESGKTYWDTKEKFLEGIERSLKHRWKINIQKHLVPVLSKEEIDEFKKLFDGQIKVPIEPDDENGDASPDLFSQE